MAKPNKIAVFAGGGGAFAPEAPIFNKKHGGFLNLGFILDNKIEGGTLLGVGGSFTALEGIGKLFVNADKSTEGTFTINDEYRVGLDMGFLKRGELHKTDSGKPFFAMSSAELRGIGLDILDTSTPSRELDFENPEHGNYEGDSERIYGLRFTKTTKILAEFWAGDFYIAPFLGFELSVMKPFIDENKYSEWPISAQEMLIFGGLDLGYGRPRMEFEKGKDDLLFYLRHFYAEGHDIGYEIIRQVSFSGHQLKATEFQSDVLGESDDKSADAEVETVAPLLSASIYTSAEGKIRPVSFYLQSDTAGKIISPILETGKSIGFIWAGSDGNPEDTPLLTNGLTSINNLLTIGGSELFIKDEENIFLLGIILGSIEIGIGSAFGRDSVFGQALMEAGITTSLGWTNPEQGNARFVTRLTRTYYPAVFMWGTEGSEISGALSTRYYLYNEDEPDGTSGWFTESRITTSALSPWNAGKMVYNEFAPREDEAPLEITTTNILSSLIGYQLSTSKSRDVYLSLDLGFGASYLIYGDSSSTGALTGLLGAQIGFNLFDNADLLLKINTIPYLGLDGTFTFPLFLGAALEVFRF